MNDQPDEQMVSHVPCGYRLNFIAAALTKRALQSSGIKTGVQLFLLEKLNGLTDLYLSPEMLALVDPMSDIEYRIFATAKSLDIESDSLSPAQKTQASFAVLTSNKVFSHFVALNPGMAKAIRWRPEPCRAATYPTTAPGHSLPASDADAPQHFHISNVPTQTAGPASIWPIATAFRSARDTDPPPPSNFDVFTGKG